MMVRTVSCPDCYGIGESYNGYEWGGKCGSCNGGGAALKIGEDVFLMPRKGIYRDATGKFRSVIDAYMANYTPSEATELIACHSGS